MDALTVSLEIAAIQEKTRRLVLWSLVAHAILAVLVLSTTGKLKATEESDVVLTEITWLPEPETTPVVIADAIPNPQAEPVVMAEPEPAPEPIMPDQGPSVALVQERLAALRASRTAGSTLPTPTTAETPVKPATLGSFAARTPQAAQDMKRSVTGTTRQASPLTRGKASVVAASAAVPASHNKRADAVLREIMPGISLAGEVSGRQLVSYLSPSYPEWAKRDGVEVSVQLFFTVLADGRVKENILIEQTSGYDDFDRRARQALAVWQFEALNTQGSGEQWGRIEFKYRLRTAG
jgi:TonB family protein